MEKLILSLFLFFLFAGSLVSAVDLNLEVGKTKVHPVKVYNPLNVEDDVKISISSDTDAVNVWAADHEQEDSFRTNIKAEINRTFHLKVLGAKCTNPSGCTGNITLKAESSISGLSTEKGVSVEVISKGGGGMGLIAPGIEVYSLIILGVLGALIAAFRTE